jgi:hypothetical protein
MLRHHLYNHQIHAVLVRLLAHWLVSLSIVLRHLSHFHSFRYPIRHFKSVADSCHHTKHSQGENENGRSAVPVVICFVASLTFFFQVTMQHATLPKLSFGGLGLKRVNFIRSKKNCHGHILCKHSRRKTLCVDCKGGSTSTLISQPSNLISQPSTLI